MMVKKTVMIGIPAHNEEKNIGRLLKSILNQQTDNFVIDSIVVSCDGCNDNTANVVSQFTKKFKFIKLNNDKKRVGQAERLNEFYRNLKSDIFITFDADVVLANSNVLSELVSAFKDSKVGLAGGRKIVLNQHTFVGKVLKTYEHFWLGVIEKLEKGQNLHNHQGPISAGSRKFLAQVTIPKGIIASDHFLYFEAIKQNFQFKFVKKAAVYFKVPSNIKDYFSQSTRFNDSAERIKDYFGGWVEKYYSIPISIKLHSYINVFFKSPFYLLCALFLQGMLRVSTYHYSEKGSSGYWASIKSSK